MQMADKGEKLSDELLAEIAKGCEGVTPGPWHVQSGTDKYTHIVRWEAQVSHAMTEWSAATDEAIATIQSLDHECRASMATIAEERARAEAAESRCERLVEALKRLDIDANQIMSQHDPRDHTLSGDAAVRRIHQFVRDAAPFIASVGPRAREALEPKP